VEDRLVEQGGDVIVVQGIDHLPTRSLPDDKSELAQHPQLVRYRRGLHLDGVGELPDGAITFTEASEDPDAAGGREGLHRDRDGVGGGSVDVRRFRGSTVCAVSHTREDAMLAGLLA
jgi:hypothetical protein